MVCIKNVVNQPTVITTIHVKINLRIVKKILFHWDYFEVNSFGLIYIPETNVLFIGGGTLTVSLDLDNFRILNENYNDCMFWYFERYNDYVIEYGELDCFLYSLRGVLLDKCSVDPPYEVEKKQSGIKFLSPVYKEQWLRYKNYGRE